jgi:hypothetical protein
MKESRSERLAIHIGLESGGVVRESNVEALTGEGAGRVFSRETYTLRNADAFRVGGRQNRIRRYREPHLLILASCLTYPLQRTVRISPALSPGRVLLLRIPLGQTSSLHPLRHRWSGFVRGLHR